MARTSWLSAILLLWVGTAALAQNDLFLVDRFDHEVQNELHGYRSTFHRLPSRADALRVTDIRRGGGGHSMQIRAARQAAGFCGLWIHLFDMRAETRQLFDARDYEYLSFWVRGESGTERFSIQLADEFWLDKEDSVLLGRSDEFLPGGVTTEWREVLVPLDRAALLDRRRLAALVINFETPGTQTVYLDDVSFKKSRAVTTPLSRAAKAVQAAAATRPKAMWVWSTERLLADNEEAESLLQFCRRQQIGTLWLQLLYDMKPARPVESRPARDGAAEQADLHCTIRQPEDVRRFLARAHALQIAVHALDGYPEFAQRAYHGTPLAIVDAVLAFNRQSLSDQRFDGVHFDNEPYLLLGWHDKIAREQILCEFLELNVECQRRVRSEPGLQFGVDIPFWWQTTDETYGGCVGDVTFHGVRKAASYHVIDQLDNVGVMDYRDSADGADGMIAHARDLVAYAAHANRANIWLGVETFAYEPTTVWFAAGLPKQEFLARLQGEARTFAALSRLDGVRLRSLDDGSCVHVGVELVTDTATPVGFVDGMDAQAIRKLARVFSRQQQESAANREDAALAQIESFVASSAEWRNYRRHDITDPATGTQYPGCLVESVMLSKITFADDTYERVQTQVRAVDDYFRRYGNYEGIAIHCYDTLRAMVDRSNVTSLRRKPFNANSLVTLSQ